MKTVARVALILIGIVLLTVLVGPYLIPIPSLEDTIPPEQLADPDSRFIEVDGLRVH